MLIYFFMQRRRHSCLSREYCCPPFSSSFYFETHASTKGLLVLAFVSVPSEQAQKEDFSRKSEEEHNQSLLDCQGMRLLRNIFF